MHAVTISDESLTKLANNRVVKSELLDFSIGFLIDRELHTSISDRFDINVIPDRYSEFSDEFDTWCDLNSK